MQQIPPAGAIEVAGAIQTFMAASKLRLFTQGYIVGPNDTTAALEAVEATFSGYTSGGYALTTWSAPSYNPSGGVITISPQVEPTYTPPGSGSPVTNTLGGWFVTDAGGNLVADGSFNTPIPMTETGNSFAITVAFLIGQLTTSVQSWVNGQQQQ